MTTNTKTRIFRALYDLDLNTMLLRITKSELKSREFRSNYMVLNFRPIADERKYLHVPAYLNRQFLSLEDIYIVKVGQSVSVSVDDIEGVDATANNKSDILVVPDTSRIEENTPLQLSVL